MNHTHGDGGSDRLLRVANTFRYHTRMLSDRPRNEAFFEALRRRVTPGCTVLDIGAGTGLWSIAAARLGAQKVLAVEQDEYLVPVVRNLARENGVADIVEVVFGKSQEIEPGVKVDVVVTEMIGNQGFDELIIPIVLDARKRLLKETGSIIPERVRLLVAAARFDGIPASLPVGVGVPLDYGYFDSINSNVPKVIRDRSKLQLLSGPQELLGVDLTTLESEPSLANLSTRWTLDKAADVNCFAIWAESTLTDDIEVSTLDADTHWEVVLYPVEKFNAAHGEVEFTLSIARDAHFWTATLVGENGEKEVQSFSPVFAQTTLEAQMQTGAG